jgi:predicted Rossmann fold nucleotide-binding protein DprA/Smf involved in DNA uptake
MGGGVTFALSNLNLFIEGRFNVGIVGITNINDEATTNVNDIGQELANRGFQFIFGFLVPIGTN